jgi:hypothetical protein
MHPHDRQTSHGLARSPPAIYAGVVATAATLFPGIAAALHFSGWTLAVVEADVNSPFYSM